MCRGMRPQKRLKHSDWRGYESRTGTGGVMPKLYTRHCEQCGRLYEGRSPNYCSWKCYKDSKWVNIICHMCGDTKRVRKRKDEKGMKFCSPECAQRFSRVQEGRFYKGKRYTIDHHGYFSATNSSRTKLHRDIWQDHNGEIPEDHIVHHKNGDRLDNRIENLELMKWGEHTKHHNLERAEN
jgi:hypothetical protein